MFLFIDKLVYVLSSSSVLLNCMGTFSLWKELYYSSEWDTSEIPLLLSMQKPVFYFYQYVSQPKKHWEQHLHCIHALVDSYSRCCLSYAVRKKVRLGWSSIFLLKGFFKKTSEVHPITFVWEILPPTRKKKEWLWNSLKDFIWLYTHYSKMAKNTMFFCLIVN